MEKHTNLILTGWGHAEYVTAAAVALKALKGDADVMGVSRRRLPELMEEIAERKKGDRWSVIYLLGVALIGDPPRLAAALAKLKVKGVNVMWISALEIPEEAAEALNGLMEVKVFDLTLLEAVGHVFGADVGPYMPFLNRERGMGNWERIPRAKRAAQAVARGVGMGNGAGRRALCKRVLSDRPLGVCGIGDFRRVCLDDLEVNAEVL